MSRQCTPGNTGGKLGRTTSCRHVLDDVGAVVEVEDVVESPKRRLLGDGNERDIIAQSDIQGQIIPDLPLVLPVESVNPAAGLGVPLFGSIRAVWKSQEE